MPALTALKPLMLGGATGANLTLAVAESLTSGRLQARIGAISGASGFFLGGITAYTLEQKVLLLGVPRELAAPVNCVSKQVALAMAEGASRLFGAEIALATTGYAEPAPAQKITRPFAWIALARATAGKTRAHARRVNCPATLSRAAVQQHIANAACAMLLDHLRRQARKHTPRADARIPITSSCARGHLLSHYATTPLFPQ